LRIRNDRGAFVACAEITDRARPGVVVAPSIWWRKLAPGGENANAVTSQALTDMGRAATFYDCLVEIERLSVTDAGTGASADRSTMSLDAINAMDEASFVAALGGVFEHSPWVARRAYAARPFASLDALHHAMNEAMRHADKEQKLALLRAHPELASKAAIAGEVTPDSRREQRGAGLDRCTPEQYARLVSMNERYRKHFGFPFIVAVKGYDVPAILDAFERRLASSGTEEFDEALRQVARIARFRLDTLFGG
jgi:2-oxo-4-hydroxy-4-carboxy-5-ureidoimidazoline decarboxylase